MVYSIKNYLPDFDEQTINELLRQRLKDYFGCKGVTLASSGTAALEVALKALDLPRGTAVLIPDISFIATASAVASCGLIPVFCDVSEQNFGLTLEAVKKNYTEGVGAVITVHIAGYVNREVLAIKQFCEEKNIFLIEDTAQAFPCTIKGRHAGTVGDIGVFSLQSSKIVSACEGGIVLTNSERLALTIGQIANWGLEGGKRNLELPVGNFRLSAIQSYFVLKQLDVINQIVKERKDRVEELTEYCSRVGITVSNPKTQEGIVDCPFFFVIRSTKNINMIEPRTECPMRKSTIIKTIFRRFYPDLLKEYACLNRLDAKNTTAEAVLRENEFINIYQQRGKSPEEIFKDYIN